MKQYKIIIDTDIGDDVDDAYALALAMCMPEIELLGVVTTYRNATMRCKIARALMEEWRPKIPVYAGLDSPEKEPFHNFDYETFVDGKPVIGQYEPYMEHYRAATGCGIEFMAQTLKKYPHTVHIAAIGPLTDIAALIQQYPDEAALVGSIVLMGGHFTGQRPEWNIRCDPEAADVVFRSGLPVRAIGWEITTQTVFDCRTAEYFRSLTGLTHSRLQRMTEIWLHNNRHRNPPIMHDALAVAGISRDFCSFTKMDVRVELDGPLRGQTIAAAGGNIDVAQTLDVKGFFEFLKKTIHACVD